MTLAGHSMVSLSKSAVVIGGYNGTSVQSKLYQIRLLESNKVDHYILPITITEILFSCLPLYCLPKVWPSALAISLQQRETTKARTYLKLPLQQWGAGNIHLLVLSR